MKYHKWENNKCVKCGIIRRIEKHRLCMAIVNHPPWNYYKYLRYWIYSFDEKRWTKSRFDCKG